MSRLNPALALQVLQHGVHPFGGASTSLEPTTWVDRYLSARYDGRTGLAPGKLATGLAYHTLA